MTEKYNDDGAISEQWLAEQIAEREGKIEEQNIAQIKESLKITLEILHTLQQEDPDKFNEMLDFRALD